jgi:mitochondrial fission protein ELM1
MNEVAAIKKAIHVPCYWHDWPYGDENPYLGYLAVADAVIVTGDSVSMISDACFTGVPVYIAPMRDLPEKHRRFHVQMVEKRLVRPFTGGYFVYEYEPLDEASRVADEIRKRFPDLT